MLLIIIVIIPIIGVIIRTRWQRVSIITAGINLIISIIIWLGFDYNDPNFQYVIKGITGVDGISILFIILTTFLTLQIVNEAKEKRTEIIILILSSLLIITFISLDIIIWYICFEAILIPMFIIIITGGKINSSIKYAAYKFFIYTLMGSLMMLIGIIIIDYETGTTNYIHLYKIINNERNEKSLSESIIFILFIFSFMIKIPIFPFHIWLPYAHTEAPTYGSIILAGVLLKLGTYGLIRYILPLFQKAFIIYKPIIITLIIISVIYSSIIIIRIIDLKKIIAYSSIIHMNTSLLGIISSNPSIEGTLFVMVSHGIISSALFYCIGIIYSRTKTRIIKYYKGLSITMPIYSIVLFILIISNAGVPGTVGFIGEFICFKSFGNEYWITNLIITFMCIIIGAVYNIWLVSRILFTESSISIIDIYRREGIVLSPYIILIIILGIKPNIIIDVFNPSILSISGVYIQS